jgi:hypothetical protein
MSFGQATPTKGGLFRCKVTARQVAECLSGRAIGKFINAQRESTGIKGCQNFFADVSIPDRVLGVAGLRYDLAIEQSSSHSIVMIN